MVRIVIKFMLWLIFSVGIMWKMVSPQDYWQISVISSLGLTEILAFLIFGVLTGTVAIECITDGKLAIKQDKALWIVIVLVLLALTFAKPLYFIGVFNSNLMFLIVNGKYAAILLGCLASFYINQRIANKKKN